VSDLSLDTFPVGSLGCNCTIVLDKGAKVAVVVDPGDDFDEIRARIERSAARVVAILHTHGHIDHVGATAPLQRWSGAPARMHEADRFLYDMLAVQAAMVGLPAPEACTMAGDLVDSAIVTYAGIEFEVLHTPGHCPGSVSFLLRSAPRPVLLSGDTLFCGGIGRTDLWGGDGVAIIRSIKTRLLTLDERTDVIPGHGPNTTIGREKRSNPFLIGSDAL
jgi:glyoxylase-like metal-dependent hydrolase (beta-lactamase superfamily II)